VRIVGQCWRADEVLATGALLESKTGGWKKPPV